MWFARQLRGRCDLLVAGGPLPTCEPESFLADFDVVVRGEGEQTMVDVLAAHAPGADLGAVPGVVVAAADGGAAAAARRGPSPPTSTPSPSPPATCCPTPPTSATGGGATATPSPR